MSFMSLRSLLRSVAVLSGSLAVENRDMSPANNLGLHWRLSDKSVKKSGPNIDP